MYLLPNGKVTKNSFLYENAIKSDMTVLSQTPDFYEFVDYGTYRTEFRNIDEYVNYLASVLGLDYTMLNYEIYTDNGTKKIRIVARAVLIADIDLNSLNIPDLFSNS